jgi:hypothetical protein
MPTSWSAAEHDHDPEFEEAPEKVGPHELPTERLAVVSLVAGIAGFFLPVVGPVTAVVSGHVARGEIRKSNGRLGGDAMARTGLILGYVWLGLTVLALLVTIGFTMLLVSTRVVVQGEEFPAAIAHGDGPNVMIQRRDDGRLLIEHGEHSIGHDRLPKGTIQLRNLDLDRSGYGLPSPPEPPKQP